MILLEGKLKKKGVVLRKLFNGWGGKLKLTVELCLMQDIFWGIKKKQKED